MYPISGGYWHVDDNPQKDILSANSCSVGKGSLQPMSADTQVFTLGMN